MICRMSVPICNHLHVGGANSGRITPFKGVPLFCPLVWGTPFTQQHEILSQNTRDSRLSCGENLKSLSRLVLKRYRVVTDRQTDGRTDRQNYHS